MNIFVVIATIFVGAANDYGCGFPTNSDVIATREGYAVGFNDTTHCPDWTMHRLTSELLMKSNCGRTEDFRHDVQIPRSAELSDYKGSGWTRGHMVPAADMKWSASAMSATFLLSNMVPQDSRNNSGAWNRIEQLVREWVKREKSLIIITGPIYDDDVQPRYIGESKVRVPDFLYKVVLDETPPVKMIAFIVPNHDVKKKPWQLTVSVDEVEEATGLDFFRELDIDEKDRLEKDLNLMEWGIGPSR